MRVLQVHNRYREIGGEDMSVARDVAALKNRGHNVYELTVGGASSSAVDYAQTGLSAWNAFSARKLREACRVFQPDVVHINNTWPLLSPSVTAIAPEIAPTVITLRNYRSVCAKGTLFRAGGPCDECISSRFSTPAIRHRCYRGSAILSGLSALSISNAKRLAVYDRATVLVALSNAHRRKLQSTPEFKDKQIVVRYNPVGPAMRPVRPQNVATFVGRDGEGKGLDRLLEAWRLRWDTRKPVLQIVGPTRRASTEEVVFHGELSNEETRGRISSSMFLVAPSTWDEPFGRTAAEALASGVPVIAGRGGPAELVEASGGEAGVVWDPGNALALEGCVRMISADRDRYSAGAKRFFEGHLSERTLTLQLEAIYDGAVADWKKTHG